MTDDPTDNEPEDDLDDLELFFEFAESRSRAVRNRLVERHMGLAATSAYHVGTIHSTGADGDGDTPLDRIDALASDESGYERAMDVQIVDGLLARLPEREREIVRLRFYEQLSQEQIAAAVGVS